MSKFSLRGVLWHITDADESIKAATGILGCALLKLVMLFTFLFVIKKLYSMYLKLISI